MGKLMTRIFKELTLDNLWYFSKSLILFVYRSLIGDLFTLFRVIGRAAVSRNWFKVIYKSLNQGLITERVHVKVMLANKKEFRCCKYKLGGTWYYKTDKGYMNDEQLMNWVGYKLTVVNVPKSGKVSKSVIDNHGLHVTWFEKHSYLTPKGYVISSTIKRVIDPLYKKHVISSVSSLHRAKIMKSFKIGTIPMSIIGPLSFTYRNKKVPFSLTKNYDALDTQRQLVKLNNLNINTTSYMPSELLLSAIFFIRKWIISLIISLTLCLVFFFLRDIPVNKHLFSVISLGLFAYLLISGFVFFLKKYRYAKYTTAMHRFWRRSFSIFWALEGFLFVVFMYLTFLCNQEPFFMYDNMQFFKDYTYSWRFFIHENSLVLIIVFILNFSLIRLKEISTIKTLFLLLITSVVYFYLTYVEFYQFYYTISHYNPTVWLFDYEFSKWYIDLETTQTKRTRILLHFITICLIAKFWHFVFILSFWIFSVSKWLQTRQVTFQLLGANLQNAVILYLLNWILMYPWIKVAFRKFLFRHYKWLYVNFRSIGSRVILNDIIFYSNSLLSKSINLVTKVKLNYAFIYYNIQGSDMLRSDFTVNLIK